MSDENQPRSTEQEPKPKQHVDWTAKAGVLLLAWVFLSTVFVNDGNIPPIGLLLGLLGIALIAVGLVRRR